MRVQLDNYMEVLDKNSCKAMDNVRMPYEYSPDYMDSPEGMIYSESAYSYENNTPQSEIYPNTP